MRFIEENNKEELMERLEKEKNTTIMERAEFLQDTFSKSLIYSEKKVRKLF